MALFYSSRAPWTGPTWGIPLHEHQASPALHKQYTTIHYCCLPLLASLLTSLSALYPTLPQASLFLERTYELTIPQVEKVGDGLLVVTV